MITNLLVVYVLVVTVLTLADGKMVVWQRGFVKMFAASMFLCLPALSASSLGTFEWWFFIGLMASWLGDLCLVWSGTGARFKLGVLSFLLAHVAYGVAFVFVDFDAVTAGSLMVLFSAIGFAVYRKLKEHMSTSLRVPVQVYILALCAMTALAWSVRPPYSCLAYGLAATAFLVSDISVALQRFGAYSTTHRLWGIPLYFGAQMAFAILITEEFS